MTKKAVFSVIGLVYFNRELCIADDESVNSDVECLLHNHQMENYKTSVLVRIIGVIFPPHQIPHRRLLWMIR